MSLSDATASRPLLRAAPTHPLPNKRMSYASSLMLSINLAAVITWLFFLRTQDTRANQIIPLPIDGKNNTNMLNIQYATACLLAAPLLHSLIRNCLAQKRQHLPTCSFAPPAITCAAIFNIIGCFANAISTLCNIYNKGAPSIFIVTMSAYSIAHLSDAYSSLRSSEKIGKDLFNPESKHASIRHRHRNADLAFAVSQLALATATLSFITYTIADKMPGLNISDGWHKAVTNFSSFAVLANMGYACVAILLKLSATCLTAEPQLKQSSLHKRQNSNESHRTVSGASTALDFGNDDEQQTKTPEPDGTPGVVTVAVENPFLQGLEALPNKGDLEAGSLSARSRSMG
ncbi:MAG: hypothetical protein P1U34_04210 [Coxiellaceae bacterium]|nr:hypothetical protein [Coxiellaceae bacterium]